MNKDLEELLEESVYRIALRISSAEEEFIRIAGKRLAEIGVFSPREARDYLRSPDYDEARLGDLARIKKALNAAHGANLEEIAGFGGAAAEAAGDGGLSGRPGRRFPSPEELTKTVNPLVKATAARYRAMVKSTAVNETYKKAVGGILRELAEDENGIGFPRALRRAVRELAEAGISVIEYRSGARRRMDGAVRNSLMTEFSGLIRELERSLADDLGADSWEISAHEHPAEDHAAVQGKIFTREEFEKLQNGEAAQDAEGALHHLERPIGAWNCRHIAYPFITGVSERAHSPEGLAEIGRRNEAGLEFQGKKYTLYGAEQLQRRYEAELRKTREQGELLKRAAGGDPAFSAELRKTTERIGALRAGYAALGAALDPKALRMKRERTYTPGGGGRAGARDPGKKD
jgi:hypothetical protein